MKVAPATLLVNAILLAVPVHIDCEDGIAVVTGIGFTVIVTLIEAPVHPPTVGVIVYTAVPINDPVAVNN